MLPLTTPDPGSAPAALPSLFHLGSPPPVGWRVIKLGGSTVADPETVAMTLRHVVRLAKHKRVAVVVSALAGVTDTLEALVAEARHGIYPSDTLAALTLRHLGQLTALVDRPPAPIVACISAEIQALRGVLNAFRRSDARSLEQTDEGCAEDDETRERIEHLRVLALSIGERLSARILHAALSDTSRRAVQNGAELVDATRLLVAIGSCGDATPDLASTRRRTGGHLATSRTGIWVVPGFFARDTLGRLCLLGRGGSDTSATLLGAALCADRIEIRTDVDGVYDADPRLERSAHRFEQLTFDHAERLAQGGARVLHERSIAPARAAGIPIFVHDARHAESGGTWIGTDSIDRNSPCPAVSP